MSEILGIHHASVLVSNTEAAVNFYVNILGLSIETSRPEMRFSGAWLNAGSQQIHLLELPNPDPVTDRPDHAGRDRHTALFVSGLGEILRRLKEANIPFTQSRSGRSAAFFRDPDGNGVELIER
ncbi:MAG: VOC family protein [Gammaproteobacteria bacterium]